MLRKPLRTRTNKFHREASWGIIKNGVFPRKKNREKPLAQTKGENKRDGSDRPLWAKKPINMGLPYPEKKKAVTKCENGGANDTEINELRR